MATPQPPPPFLHQSLAPFQVYPAFLAKNFVPPPPQVTQFLEGAGGGGSNYVCMYIYTYIHSLPDDRENVKLRVAIN